MKFRKHLLTGIFSLVVITGYSQINFGTNFRILTNLPIDTRMVAPTIQARDTINQYYRYEGLTVYVKSTLTNYQLRGGISNSNWLPISGGNILHWDSAYSWGNHTLAGYLTASSNNILTNKSGNISMWTNDAGYLTNLSETDPVWNTVSSNYYTKTDLQTNGSSQLNFNNIANKPSTLAGYGITDAISSTHIASAITGTKITQWDTAYSWGNHANSGYLTASSMNTLTNKSGNITMWTNNAGYLTDYEETDPIWTSVSSNYNTKTELQTSGSSQLHFNNITNKPTTLSGYGITDAISTTHVANSITGTNVTNWNSAYSWGNHATAGYLTASSTNTLTNKSGNISMWTNNAGYLTGYNETDPVWAAASSNYYTKTNLQTSGASQLHFNNITNKPSTLSGYGISDAMSSSHAANAITSTNITNWNTVYGWGNHNTAGYLKSSSDLFWNNSNKRLGIGTNSPAAALSVGNSSKFQVDSSGNILKINSITTNFPSTQGSANSILTNDGSGNLSWSSNYSGGSGSNTMTTAEGGFAIYMYNGSGYPIPQYMVVMADPNNDTSIAIAPSRCNLPIGITYDSIPNGSWGWIVISGITYVQINTSVTRSYYAYVSSSADGQVESDNNTGSSNNQRSVGHFLESVNVSQSYSSHGHHGHHGYHGHQGQHGSNTSRATAMIMVHF